MHEMKVRLLYFAVLRDIMGTAETELTLPDGTRAIDVWEAMRGAHSELSAYDHAPLTAINESYAPASAMLRDGDELAFIPPVAGG